MKALRRVLSLVIPLLLAGCAPGPKFAEVVSSIPTLAPENGRIYFCGVATFGAAIQPQVLPPKIDTGAPWETSYRAPIPQFPPSKASMQVVPLDERKVGEVRFSVARVRASGYASRPSPPVAGSYGGESFSGELLVDMRTGLVIEAKIRTTNRPLSLDRRLVEVMR
jgi:hypothetical protein